MKKFLKYILISLSCLIGLLIVLAGIAVWLVFTPEKITPILNKNTSKVFNCQVDIGNVELTFFSTFPKFGLKIENVSIINSIENSPNDTLMRLESFSGIVDIVKLWKFDELVLSDLTLKNCDIFAFIDSTGKTNYDIFITDTTASEESDYALKFIDFGNIELNNINISFRDDEAKFFSEIKNINAEISGNIKDDVLLTEVSLNSSSLIYDEELLNLNTSIKNIKSDFIFEIMGGKTNATVSLSGSEFIYDDASLLMTATLNDFDLTFTGEIFADSIFSDIKLNSANSYLDYDGDIYLQNAEIKLNIPNHIILSRQFINLYNAIASINDQEFSLDGSVEINPETWDIDNNLSYEINNWSVKKTLELVPPEYQSYISDIKTDGNFSSKGSIKGLYNDTLMPFIDIGLVLEKCFLISADIGLPINDINCNIDIYTDFYDNNLSYIKINSFSARTPKSRFETKGYITNLYSDTKFKLSSKANIELSEFNKMIPDSMNTTLDGRINAGINSSFSLNQLEEMRFEKMIFSGLISSPRLYIESDSLWLKTEQLDINFEMPNLLASASNTNFSLVDMRAIKFETGKIQDYEISLENMDVKFETSDFIDTTKTPDVKCDFSLKSLSFTMDTISLDLQKTVGKILLSSDKNIPKNLNIDISYSGNSLNAQAGDNFSNTKAIDLKLNLFYDNEEKNEMLQWLANGFIDLSDGEIIISDFNHPILIPTIKMDFTPETFNIKDSRIIIDKSDFSLSGIVENVSSYFRGDSILRARLNFHSDNTDVLQLMNLTNGLGSEEIEKSENDLSTTNNSGPYMVPKGVDFILSANITKASIGEDIARDIKGDIRVKDGILVLDDLRFTTSAAKMILTAMYRTPRKNHLYLGLDYHMLNIEIEELLSIIPDIDSLMPMLRSFRGKGEFHIAVECYLDSTYNMKKSTLRGASSISGQNLVLLDGETFTEIAKTLRFTRRAENKIDSLSAEFTIFREEIDVYPFLLVMDRYRAVVAGRHNFDLSFDYHISIVDSPLPTRLGINLHGDMDKLTYRLAKTRYPEFYRPASRGSVRTSQLELRRIIRESLTDRLNE